MISILIAVALLLPAQAEGQLAGGGLIKGLVIDATGAGLPGSFVRVLEPSSNALLTRLNAGPDGRFQTGRLSPGSYVLIASMQGFRAWRSSVMIRDGEVDLGKIQLDLAGCDAPGVVCDSFGVADAPDPVVSSGYLQMKVNCVVALARGKVYCPGEANQRGGEANADLRVVEDANGIYLTASNGAALSPPNLPRADCRDAYPSETRIRIDGLGLGDDICLHTHDRHWSHIFVTNDVSRGSEQITIWQITRKR